MERLQVSAEPSLELVTGKKSEINNQNALNSSVTCFSPSYHLSTQLLYNFM